MELALRLGISARHVSFVEIGRARASRALLERWLDEVGANHSIRNAALHHAGFVPQAPCSEGGNRSPQATPEFVNRLLTAHDPYPAFCFSADWRICSANSGAALLMTMVMPGYLQTLAPGAKVDMIEACMHPGGLLSRMCDPRAVGTGLLAQLELECEASAELQRRVARLRRHLETLFGEDLDTEPSSGSVFSFATDLGRLDFFRFQSLLDLPQDVTLNSLRVEVALPLNEHTKRVMHAIGTASESSPHGHRSLAISAGGGHHAQAR